MKEFKSIGKLVSVLYRLNQSYIKKELREYNLGPGQFQILQLLFKKEYVRQIDLAEMLEIDKTSMTRTISKLEASGYVRREKDNEDYRAYTVSLTPKANKIKSEIIPILKNWTHIVLEGFTDDEQEQFISCLIKAAANAKKEVKGDNND